MQPIVFVWWCRVRTHRLERQETRLEAAVFFFTPVPPYKVASPWPHAFSAEVLHRNSEATNPCKQIYEFE